MYADFAEFFHRALGIDIPMLSVLKMFGFFVALAFFSAAYILTLEFKRKEAQGLIHPYYTDEVIGGPIDPKEYVYNALLGFVIGYKLIALFLNHAQVGHDPVSFIFSLKGNFLAGVIGALLFLGIKYFELKGKLRDSEPRKVKMKHFPHQKVGDISVVAALSGFLGAKIFNGLENWNEFINNPIDSIISSSGFTFYGGLILATIVLYFYGKKIGLKFSHFADAAAPALILAYGIGRMGCHMSGDGDWGVFNTAYASTTSGQVIPVDRPVNLDSIITQYPNYFKQEFSTYQSIPRVHLPKPSYLSFLPDRLFANAYAYNVNNAGIPLIPCDSKNYCQRLPVPVVPTPIYEFFAGVIIFAILWALRKKIKKPFVIFGVYLIFNGIERFIVEKYRVNNVIDFFGIKSTQAEMIAVFLILFGLAIIVIQKIRYRNTVSE